MRKARLLLGMFIGLFVIFSTGCQELDSDQTGNLVIQLTDAPFPIDMIDAATVTITKVEIRIRSEGDELEYPFIPILEDTVEFNLLDLRDGVIAELLDVELEEGNYNLIRLFVDKASLDVKDGDNFDVKVPSGSESGIKIFIEPSIHITGGLTEELLLDFDLEKSFLVKGNTRSPAGINGFTFKPVIRAVNNSTSGMVAGVVMNADSLMMENVSVWIEQDTVVTSAFTDAEGYYAFPGIPAGLYAVSAAVDGYDTLTYTSVEVVAGNLTVQNFTLNPSTE